VDERGELMTDHVAGQHLPGMVLIEASRQMFIATSELYFRDGDEPSSLLVTTLNSSFFELAFPVATRIVLTVRDSNDGDARGPVEVVVDLSQGGARVSEHFGRILSCASTTASRLENRSAKRVLRTLTDP
jgi:hypothetical protein